MSYNGSGVFTINTAGQPVVTGTTISSTTFNNLTADLATGLTTALTKDGQSTPTANIGMGAFKITNLAAGTVASDAARLDQVQGGAATFVTAAGTDTITGTTSPALTAYATGNQFSFVVANTNTGAVTINVDGLGAKAITRTGTTALVAGDMVAGQTVEIIYDGTRFQLVNGNSFTNLKVSGTLGVTGVATFTAQPIVSSLTASLPVFTDASKGLVSNTMTGTGNVVMSASPTFTGTVGAAALTTTGNTILGDAATDTLNVGAGGLVKDASGNVGIGTSSPNASYKMSITGNSASIYSGILFTDTNAGGGVFSIYGESAALKFRDSSAGATRMTIDSSGNVGIGTASPGALLEVAGATATTEIRIKGTSGIGTFNGMSIYSNNSLRAQLFHNDAGGATSLTTNVGTAQTLNLTSGTTLNLTATGANVITFSTNSSERARIDSGGNLLVGATSATGKLTIKGAGTSSATKALWVSDSVGSELLYVRDDGALYSGAGAASPYSLTSAAAANMIVAADRFIYRSTSALKYKQNVRDLPSIDINKFRPVVYNSKCSGDNQAQDYFGIIADEVDAAGVKELVTYGIDGEVEGFQYERLTVVLLKAIQEQQSLITQLQADVATLKALSA
jgi:hypothetical protein